MADGTMMIKTVSIKYVGRAELATGQGGYHTRFDPERRVMELYYCSV